MKKNKLLLLAFVASICATHAQEVADNAANFPSLGDRYFGEKSPGMTPVLFDPPIVSPDGLFEGGSHSPDMRSFYFSRKNGKYAKRTFFVIRYEKDQWGSESETEIRWPQFSADGQIMYLGKEFRKRTETG